MDIRARLDTGELIDVEMQRSHFGSYGKRAVYNLNKLVNFSLDKGKDYDKIRESIVISFVDGAIFTNAAGQEAPTSISRGRNVCISGVIFFRQCFSPEI